MTDGRKDGKKDGATVEALRWAMRNFSEWTPFLILSNLIGALNTLRDRIEKDQTEELLRRPFLQLEYDFPKISPEEREKIDTEGDVEKAVNILLEKEFPDLFAWGQLTQWVSLQIGPPKEDGSPPSITVRVPPENKPLNEKLDAMTKDQREAEMIRLSRGWTIEEWGIKQPTFSRVATTVREFEFEATVAFRVLPLSVLHDGSRSFFPVLVGLDFSRGKLPAPSSLEWAEFWSQLIGFFTPALQDLYKKLQDQSAAKLDPIPTRAPTRSVPVSSDYFKAPGRIFDTPRQIVKLPGFDLLPELDRWYQINSPLNRRVAMAAVALTKYRSREELKMQEVTPKQLEELVYVGADPKGQHLFDILKSFETLASAPLPLGRVEWVPVGSGKNRRWKKRYITLRATLFQTYGLVFEDRQTRKRVFIDDPAYSKDRVDAPLPKGLQAKVKSGKVAPTEIVAKSPWGNLLKSFPAKKYKLAGIQFRWNTDVAEDFIFPATARDEKGIIRRGLDNKPLREGHRFVMVYGKWFEVAKRLTEQKQQTALNLLEFLVSEKTPLIKQRGGMVDVEIAAEKIIKVLGLWQNYQARKRRVLDMIAEAVIALQKEKVLLTGSAPWPIEYPKDDKRRDRRVAPFYRWKLAAEWSTVALISEDQAKAIDAEASAEREREESKSQEVAKENKAPQVKAKTTPIKDIQPKERFLIPGILPDIPTGEDVKVARAAAGLSLREWERRVNAGLPKGMKGPSIKLWSDIENGKVGERSIRKLAPAVLEKIKGLVNEHQPEGETKPPVTKNVP